MNDDQARDDLARVLYERDDAAEFTSWEQLPDWNRRMWHADADAILPTVRRLIADELRAATDACERIGVPAQAAVFRARADALDPPTTT